MNKAPKKVNENLKTMKPEERKKYVAGINEFARKLGAFPMETDNP